MTFRKTAEPSQVTDAKDGLTPSQRILRFPVIGFLRNKGVND